MPTDLCQAPALIHGHTSNAGCEEDAPPLSIIIAGANVNATGNVTAALKWHSTPMKSEVQQQLFKPESPISSLSNTTDAEPLSGDDSNVVRQFQNHFIISGEDDDNDDDNDLNCTLVEVLGEPPSVNFPLSDSESEDEEQARGGEDHDGEEDLQFSCNQTISYLNRKRVSKKLVLQGKKNCQNLGEFDISQDFLCCGVGGILWIWYFPSRISR